MKLHAKRIFTVLLSLLLAALPSAALCAFAADTPAVLASGYCGGEGDGTNLTWKITDDGVLTVSGRGAMADYTEIRESETEGEYTAVVSRPWLEAVYEAVMRDHGVSEIPPVSDGDFYTLAYLEFANDFMLDCAYLIRTVVLEEGVTSVGGGAFAHLFVNEVSLPSTLKTIGEMAFSETALTHVELPEGLVSIGPRAFYETPLAGVELPSTLQTIGEKAFSYTRLQYVTVRGGGLDTDTLPVICNYGAAPQITAEQFDTAYLVNNWANMMVFLNNDGIYGNWYAEEFELWGLTEDGAGKAYLEYWFTQHLIEMERYTGVRIEWDSYFGTRDAVLAEICRLLDAEITPEQISNQIGVTVGFTDVFCDAVKAYQRQHEIKSYNVAVLYDRLLNQEQAILYKAQTSDLTVEEVTASRQTELSQLYAAVAELCGVEVTDLASAKAVVLATLNGEFGTAFTEADILVVYPTYQVDYATLNAAFRTKYGITDASVSVMPLNCCWASLAEAAAGDYDGLPISPAPWYEARSCSETVLSAAAAAGVTAKTLDHTWGEPVSEPATCTTIGVNVYTCIYCGAEHREYENALGHHLVPYDETQPTYDAHGYTAGVYCTQCDTWLSGHEVIHNTFGHREVLRQPTTEEEGSVIITCTVCGEQGLYAIERLEDSGEEEKPPTKLNFIEQAVESARKAVNSVVNWILRLIKWLGKK